EEQGETRLFHEEPSRELAPPDWLIFHEEFSEAFRHCLDGLSPSHRAVLLLSLSGRTLSEIAQITGCPYGTAGRLLHEARQHMRTCLDGQGHRFVPRGNPLPPDAEIVMRF